MRAMPGLLRSRVALAALLGAFLIPVGLSSLRGLTHVLTCEEPVATPFTVVFGEGDPVVLSSVTVTAGDDDGLCGGIDVDIQAAAPAPGEVLLTLVVTNETTHPWRGTINVALGGGGLVGDTLIPVAIGRVEPGDSKTESLPVRVGEGAHEFDGLLLIGP